MMKNLSDEVFKYDTTIKKAPDMDACYVEFPFDIKDLYGKGRIKVKATFDDFVYYGSVVNMGVKNNDGSICYIIGISKKIRKLINKNAGDDVSVTIQSIE